MYYVCKLLEYLIPTREGVDPICTTPTRVRIGQKKGECNTLATGSFFQVIFLKSNDV
jgi:hypothetical protein